MRSIWIVIIGICLGLGVCACAPTAPPPPTPTPRQLPTPIPLATSDGHPRLQLMASRSQSGDKQNGSVIAMGFQPFEHVSLSATRNGQPLANVDCQILAPLEKNTAIAYPNGNFVCFLTDDNGAYTNFNVGDTVTVKATGDKGSAAELIATFQ